jgi:predicted ATPase
LLLDEPDVHLHPDLQSRLIKFLVRLAKDFDFTVMIATHSTAILGALAGAEKSKVTFMQAREKELVFEEIGEILRRVLPVFGAHPVERSVAARPLASLGRSPGQAEGPASRPSPRSPP